MSTVSFDKAAEAAEALVDYVQRLEKQEDESSSSKKSQLLVDYADEDHTTPLLPLDLVLSTKKYIVEKKSFAPIQIELPNKFFGKAASDALEMSVCVLVRDLKGSEADSIDFYNKRLVEATKNPEDALAALEAEQPKTPASNTTKKSTRRSSKITEASKSVDSIPLEELAKIKVDKVVTFSQLRTEYKPFQARRKLISEHDIFFVDSALARADDSRLLPKILGKVFFAQSKTVPQPIFLTSTDEASISEAEKVVQLAIRNKNSGKKNSKKGTLATTSSTTPLKEVAELVDADGIAQTFSLTKTLTGIYKRLHGTHFMVAPSNQIIVRIGSTALKPAEIAQNVEAAAKFIVESPESTVLPSYVKGGWPTVRGLFLKTSTGPSLPIYVSETLYENEADDVIADESELAQAAGAAETDGATVLGKRRRIQEAKISESRINELLAEIVDEEDLEKLVPKKKAAADKNSKKKDATKAKKEETPEPTAAAAAAAAASKKKEPSTPKSKKRQEREGAPSPASVKKVRAEPAEVATAPAANLSTTPKKTPKKTPAKENKAESTPVTKKQKTSSAPSSLKKTASAAATPTSASKKKRVSFGKSK